VTWLDRTIETRCDLQRLFSMFPNGWPGAGILILRLVTGTLLIRDGVTALAAAPQLQTIILYSSAVGAGLLLLAGLWTPIAGILVAIVEIWSALSGLNLLENSILLATIGSALAVLGPGSRSIDARLFGRKRIDVRDR
jgi:putative oxidoreductase